MDNEFLQTIVALLPFVILLLGFLVFFTFEPLCMAFGNLCSCCIFSYASTKNVDRVCMGEYNHLEWISCFVDGTDFWTMF